MENTRRSVLFKKVIIVEDFFFASDSDTLKSDGNPKSFRRKKMPPFSWSNSKPSKQREAGRK
jgi:hypothetical protein